MWAVVSTAHGREGRAWAWESAAAATAAEQVASATLAGLSQGGRLSRAGFVFRASLLGGLAAWPCVALRAAAPDFFSMQSMRTSGARAPRRCRSQPSLAPSPGRSLPSQRTRAYFSGGRRTLCPALAASPSLPSPHPQHPPFCRPHHRLSHPPPTASCRLRHCAPSTSLHRQRLRLPLPLHSGVLGLAFCLVFPIERDTPGVRY